MALGLCLQLALHACRGQATPPAELVEGDPLLGRLSELSFDSMLRLGAHHMSGTMIATAEGPSRTFASTERYDLRWESQRRYAYQILKDDRPTMDVVVLGDKAFQIRSDGRATARSNVHDFHYYLQQTWNLWATAAAPFKDSLTLTPVGEVSRGGRPADQYAIGLKGGSSALDQGSGGSVETRLQSATGMLEIDRSTLVPLAVNFEGRYQTVRFSRVPGRANPTTTHTITLELQRDELGQSQSVSAPELIPQVAAPPKTRPSAGSNAPLTPARRRQKGR